MSITLSKRVASLALATFESLPQRCKPRVQADGRREWTPMSAIVVAFEDTPQLELKCVSLAIGTKCLPASQIGKCNGLILHDCHAEVLALRGLNRWVLMEMKLMAENPGYTSMVLELIEIPGEVSPPSGFRVRENISVYMFTTTAPCGDASMDLLIAATSDQTPWSTDSLASDLASGQPLGRGHFSLLGAVRRKPARRDAEATMSKSCTDKIALKQFTGLLAFPTNSLIPFGSVFLKGLVVYSDQYDSIGYERAFGKTGRLRDTFDAQASFFDVNVLPKDFPRFHFERTSHSVKVTNIAAVYIAGPEDTDATHETLINGVKQGFKHTGDRPQKGSVLCRRKMSDLALEIVGLMNARGIHLDGFGAASYHSAKQALEPAQRRQSKELVLRTLTGWISNSAEDNFAL